MAGWHGTGAYRTGLVVALVVAFLTVWTTIVRDDGSGAGFFMIILAVGVGWFAAGFRATGMARAMVGVAAMQMCLGALIATAPVTANVPGGPLKVLLFNGFFSVLWLISAALFSLAAKGEHEAAIGEY